jgi:hypothetical protein
MHVGPKKKRTNRLSSRPVWSLVERSEVEWRPIGSMLPINRNDDEKIQRASKMHSWVVSEHHGRQDGRYDGPKRRIEEKVGRVATWWEMGFPIGRHDEENKRASKTHL